VPRVKKLNTIQAVRILSSTLLGHRRNPLFHPSGDDGQGMVERAENRLVPPVEIPRRPVQVAGLPDDLNALRSIETMENIPAALRSRHQMKSASQPPPSDALSGATLPFSR